MKLMRWRLLNVACRPWISLTSRSPHLRKHPNTWVVVAAA